jgi:uncharacterized membrane protein
MHVLLLSAGLGWVAGMRSATAPAAVAAAFALRPRLMARPPARWLASERVAGALAVAAAGELVVDKLPSTPDRTSPPVLAGRLLSGALVGAAVAARHRKGIAGAALVGAASAGASSFAMMAARKAAGEAVGTMPAALGEDALAVALGAALARAAR